MILKCLSCLLEYKVFGVEGREVIDNEMVGGGLIRLWKFLKFMMII